MLLALDTATTTASLALYDRQGQQLLAEETWLARRRQTQELLVVAKALLARLDLVPQSLSALAVTTGPGSFTGVRIGISTVKGIGMGLTPAPSVIGLPTLSVTAAPWLALAQRNNAQVCAVIQAGRGRYNWGFFHAHAQLRGICAADHHAGKAPDLIASLRHCPAPIWLAGELDDDLQAQLTPLPQTTVIDRVSGLRRAGVLARLAAEQLAAGVDDSLRDLQPLYLQTP